MSYSCDTSPAASTVGFFFYPGVDVANIALYVDGFNLYYRKLRDNPPLKWLDLEALGRRLAPGTELTKVAGAQRGGRRRSLRS
jgi:hypothetical protein